MADSNIIKRIIIAVLGGTAIGIGVNEADKHFHYYADGYNRLGYDREGYDRDGYNSSGYDKEGFDRNGFDEFGYDRYGYNSKGFDCRGYDKNGRDSKGYDRSGYDVEGYTRKGFDKQGYDRNGFDKSGHTHGYYNKVVLEIKNRNIEAHKQMKIGKYEYALHDIRIGIEKGVKAVLAHAVGKGYEDNKLFDNINICKDHRVFELEFIEKLHSARIHCNDTSHEDCDKEYGQVYFCYKVLEELIEKLKDISAIPISENNETIEGFAEG